MKSNNTNLSLNNLSVVNGDLKIENINLIKDNFDLKKKIKYRY